MLLKSFFLLNALFSSPDLSKANIHPLLLALTMSLCLNSSFPFLMPSVPFPNTVRNMKEKLYPLSVFVSLNQTYHTFLVSPCKISFLFPDHPHNPSLLLFQNELIFFWGKKSLRANSLFVPHSSYLSSIFFYVMFPELQFRFRHNHSCKRYNLSYKTHNCRLHNAISDIRNYWL